MERSLQRPRTARTVLLRMAADQERAERIRSLKDRHPDITFRMMGDAAGVSERAAADWPRTGGIAPENTKKLAALFQEHGENIDWRWLHFGAESDTPSPFAGRDQVADIREEFREDVDEIRRRLTAIEEHLAAADKSIRGQLAVQDKLLADIRALVEPLRGVRLEVSEPDAEPERDPLPDPERLVGPRAPAKPERTTGDQDAPAAARRRKPA